MGNRNRPIGLSNSPGPGTLPVGGGGMISFSIFVVFGRTCPLYERVGTSNILSCFVVGMPGPEYGLPVAVI